MTDPQSEFPPRIPDDWAQWTPEQKDEFRRSVESQLRSAKARSAETVAMIRAGQRAFWEECLGSRLSELTTSRVLTERALTDSDPKVRLGAVKLISEFWKPTLANDSALKQLVLADPDSAVRTAATYCWSRLHRGTRNRGVCVALARVAKDAMCSLDLRCAAYIGLHDVLGRDLPFEVLKSLYTAKEGMPEGLDWSRVKPFLT